MNNMYPNQFQQPVYNQGFTVPYCGGYSAGYMNNQSAPGFTVNQQPIQFTQTLTADELKLLQNTGNGLNLKIEPIDLARAACVHKTPDGKNFSVYVTDEAKGTVKCTQCGAEFTMETYPEDVVNDAMKVVLDVIQQSKLMWLTGPAQMMKDYYAFIPLLEKLPQVAKTAQKDYAKLNTGYNMNTIPEQRGFQVLDSLGGIIPNYGAPMQQYNYGAAYPQAPVAPAAPMYGYQPPVAPPAAPVAPAPVAPQGVNPFGNQQQFQQQYNYGAYPQAPVAPAPVAAPPGAPVGVQPPVAPAPVKEEVTVIPNI